MASEYDFVKNQRAETESGQSPDEFEAPEISPEEFADHIASSVANAISATGMFEVVEIQAGVGQIHVMGRVKKEVERSFMRKVVHPILTVMENNDDCSGFVGKQFILRNGDMRYAWVISFASNDLRRAATLVCQSFEQSVVRREVMESPLLGQGAPQSGGARTGRKGATAVR